MNHQHAIREEELKNRVASGASVPIFGDAELVSSSGKSEIRIVKTRQQLKSLGLLPQNDEDGVSEMAWLDMGSADPAQCLR